MVSKENTNFDWDTSLSDRKGNIANIKQQIKLNNHFNVLPQLLNPPQILLILKEFEQLLKKALCNTNNSGLKS